MKYKSLMMLSVKEGFDPNSSVALNSYLFTYDKYTKFWCIGKLKPYKKAFELDRSFDIRFYSDKSEAAADFTGLITKTIKKNIKGIR